MCAADAVIDGQYILEYHQVKDMSIFSISLSEVQDVTP